MTDRTDETGPSILVEHHPRMLTVILNRPHVLNVLNLGMIRLIRQALEAVQSEDGVDFILLLGAGEKGFCAGGDLKPLAEAARNGALERADQFFQEEYALDLLIHRFPKPVIAFVDGITMGGGLGLAAGADIILATERTRMAMPETRIGFFPDVGATGWMFKKCPRGYPEYLGLTGYEMTGSECVRLGFATDVTEAVRLTEIRAILERCQHRISPERRKASQQLRSLLVPFFAPSVPSRPEFDAWVADHFAGKASIPEIIASLSQCALENDWCEQVFHRLSERSPTALVLTLKLLRHNENRPLDKVFAAEAKATRFILTHPDYLEGIRARILDKDDRPRWQPPTVDEVPPIDLGLES